DTEGGSEMAANTTGVRAEGTTVASAAKERGRAYGRGAALAGLVAGCRTRGPGSGDPPRRPDRRAGDARSADAAPGGARDPAPLPESAGAVPGEQHDRPPGCGRGERESADRDVGRMALPGSEHDPVRGAVVPVRGGGHPAHRPPALAGGPWSDG